MVLSSLFISGMDKGKERTVYAQEIKLEHVDVKLLKEYKNLLKVYGIMKISIDELSNTILLKGEEKTVCEIVSFIKESLDVKPVEKPKVLHIEPEVKGL